MRKIIIFSLVLFLISSCTPKDIPWKDIEIVDVCSFSIPEMLQCADSNEFVSQVSIDHANNYVRVSLDESKNSMKQVMTFKSDRRRLPFWVKVTIENRNDCSYRYAGTVMEVADYAIPFLEKNLLESYLEFEGIDEKEMKKFDWLPIRIVEKDRTRYLVVEYKMPDKDNKQILRVVHSIFLFHGKRVVFSIYCNDKKLHISENDYIRFIESISFANLRMASYNVYSDINTGYVFLYPKEFTLVEEVEDYSTSEQGHNIKLIDNGITINIRLLQEIIDNEKIQTTMEHLNKNLPYDHFSPLRKSDVSIIGQPTKYVDFKYNDGNDKFFGRGYFVTGTPLVISCIVHDVSYRDKADQAMQMILNSLSPQDCTYCCYKP